MSKSVELKLNGRDWWIEEKGRFSLAALDPH